MNRIETKIIIMVTNRLASAKESDAKTEMIEELSENLYQRYLETYRGNRCSVWQAAADSRFPYSLH